MSVTVGGISTDTIWQLYGVVVPGLRAFSEIFVIGYPDKYGGIVTCVVVYGMA